MKEVPSWDDLCGEHTLYAISTDIRHPFDDAANGVIIEFEEYIAAAVFEDPKDGYRSAAAGPLIGTANTISMSGYIRTYINVPVMVSRWTDEDGTPADGIQIYDRRNGKIILTVGTRRVDDYYPNYVCEWTPENIQENQP